MVFWHYCMLLLFSWQTAFKQLKEDVGHGRLHLDSIDGAIQDEVSVCCPSPSCVPPLSFPRNYSTALPPVVRMAVSRIWLKLLSISCSWVVFIVTLQTTALFHNITTLSSLLVYFYFGYSDVHSSTATACISCFYGRYHSTMARVHRYYNFTTASFGKHSLVVCLCDGWSSRVISWMVEGCMDDPIQSTLPSRS